MKYLFLLLLALLGGCTSKYYDARFMPTTTEAIANSSEALGGQARSIVRVIGMRKQDSKAGTPAMFEFRMRIENLGQAPCTLEQHSLQLLSGTLEPFAAAQLESSDPPVIAPGASANYTLLFPLPEGRRIDDVDVLSLNLRWVIAFDAEAVTMGVSFERVVPLDSSSSHFSVGVGFWGS